MVPAMAAIRPMTGDPDADQQSHQSGHVLQKIYVGVCHGCRLLKCCSATYQEKCGFFRYCWSSIIYLSVFCRGPKGWFRLVSRYARGEADGDPGRFLSEAIAAGEDALLRADPDDPGMRFNTQVLLFRAHKSLAVSGVCDDVGRELDMALACIDAALPHLGPELAAVKP